MVKTVALKIMPTLKAGILKSKKFTLSKTINAKAFTFMEVLIALAVVSTALIGLIRLHIISVNMAGYAELNCSAADLANSKITEIIAAGFPQLGSQSGTAEQHSIDMHWRSNVTDVNPGQIDSIPTGNLRKISVEVSYPRGRDIKTIHMSTLVANRNR